MTGRIARSVAGGAQVVAEAMPYITHRRSDCNRVDGRTRQRVASVTSFAADEADRGPRPDLARPSSEGTDRQPCEVRPDGVEYLVRAARVTDIDRIVALRDDGRSDDRAPRARSMPRISCASSSTCRRPASSSPRRSDTSWVGRSSRFARRSSAGGYVGTIDLLVVDPGHDVDRITEALVEELLRSASNKGCTVVEDGPPDDPMERTRLGTPGLRRSRTATATNRDRGGSRRASHLMTVSPSSVIAPAGRTPRPKEYTVGKNVAVFVDVANIFYAAKAAGVDIDYVTLLKSATAGRDLVRAYAYTGLDPDNENQRNFHDFLRAQRLQGRQQGHPQVRRRQGQGEPRHRAGRRHDEDRPEPRHRDRRLRRRRLRAGHPRRPGAGRPRRGDQLPRQHQLRPHRGRRPVHRHHPAGARREGLRAPAAASPTTARTCR